MIKTIHFISILFLALLSANACCFSTKNTSLGGNFYISEYSFKELSIMYCYDKCCNAGMTIIPQTLVAYNFDENWIVAKSDSIYDNNKSDFAYWIFNKRFNSIKKDIGDSIKVNVYGPLDSLSFYRMLSAKGIQLKLINYIK